MLEALRAFIDEISGGPASRPPGPDDARLAAVALLVHVANVDGTLDPAERIRLNRIVEERYGLSASESRDLILRAAQSESESVDLFHFTNVLKRNLDDAGRHGVIEALWDMAYADGQVHEFEENVVWRVAELLGVSTRDRVELRQRAESAGPESAAPWGAPTKAIGS